MRVSGGRDLVVRRMDLEKLEDDSAYVAQRESYTDLAVNSVTEDAAGTPYVLTRAGGRGLDTPTACKLPLEGKLSCYLLPSLRGDSIVGGKANAIYAFGSSPRHSAVTEPVLQQYELP